VPFVGEAHTLLRGQIEVFDSWSIKCSPLRVAQLPERLLGKHRGVEGEATIATIGVDIVGPKRRCGVEQVVVHTVAQASEQGPVGVIEERHRQAGEWG
jgi:hypothetical protein